MADTMVFQFIGDTIDTALNTYVNATSATVASKFVATAVLGATLYYTLNGLMLALGRVQAPLSNFLISGVKFALIAALALNADIYVTWVVEALRSLEVGLASAFSGTNGQEPSTVYEVLDNALGQAMDVSARLWESAQARPFTSINMAFGEYVCGGVIALAAIAIMLPACAMIVIAKATLSLMLGIGPLFIMLLMWPVTRQFFDRWISVVFTSILQIALLAAVAAFAIKGFMAFVEPIKLETEQLPLFAALQVLIVALIMLALLYAVNSVAAQLGGGISSAAVTLQGMARGAAQGLSSPGRATMGVANVINAKSTRRDLEAGQMVTAGRTNHLIAGNTIANPAYRQHVMQSLGKNWGRASGGKLSK